MGTAADPGGGITFTTEDYHRAPVLPPNVICSCETSSVAYTSVVDGGSSSAGSSAATPSFGFGAPVVGVGASGIAAGLRLYRDAGFSLPISPGTVVFESLTR